MANEERDNIHRSRRPRDDVGVSRSRSPQDALVPYRSRSSQDTIVRSRSPQDTIVRSRPISPRPDGSDHTTRTINPPSTSTTHTITSRNSRPPVPLFDGSNSNATSSSNDTVIYHGGMHAPGALDRGMDAILNEYNSPAPLGFEWDDYNL